MVVRLVRLVGATKQPVVRDCKPACAILANAGNIPTGRSNAMLRRNELRPFFLSKAGAVVLVLSAAAATALGFALHAAMTG